MRVLDAYPLVADRFECVREEAGGAFVSCACPLKAHRTSRLRLWLGDDGRLLFGCYACGPAAKVEILRAAGLRWADCYPAGTDWERVRRELVATYDYRDEGGTLLYQTCRLEPGHRGKDKTFFQRRPRVPGSRPRGRADWVNGLYERPGVPAVRLVLYRLPELLAADPARPVFVAAGEKDAESLREIGCVATTNVCGESAEWRDGYSAALDNRHVVVVEDADAAGRRHANEVCGGLLDHAASVRRLRLPAQDATAFLGGLRRAGVVRADRLRAALLAELARARTWVGAGPE